MEKNKCTILVNSCDKYEDLWNPFFTCLKQNWNAIPYPIVLNTESKSYSFEDLNITTFNLYKENANVAWGKRMLDTLKRIDTKYIIFLLDDFFIKSPVDIERLEKCITWMEENSNIATFGFWRTRGNNIVSEKYEDFELRDRKGEYRFNCQAAIWNRKKLIKFIRSHESPWDWELLGSIRSRRYKEEIYSLIEGKKPIFDYYTGGAVHRGKWVLKCVEPLIKRYELKIDLNVRGYQQDYNTENFVDKDIPKKTFWQKVKNRLKLYWTRFKSLV